MSCRAPVLLLSTTQPAAQPPLPVQRSSSVPYYENTVLENMPPAPGNQQSSKPVVSPITGSPQSLASTSTNPFASTSTNPFASPEVSAIPDAQPQAPASSKIIPQPEVSPYTGGPSQRPAVAVVDTRRSVRGSNSAPSPAPEPLEPAVEYVPPLLPKLKETKRVEKEIWLPDMYQAGALSRQVRIMTMDLIPLFTSILGG